MAILTRGIRVPHFNLPFKFGTDGHADTVEQDTMEDITNCVAAIARTTVGQREEMPEFGIPDFTFGAIPLAAAEVTEAILDQEPRAAVTVAQDPDKFSILVTNLLVKIAAHPEVSGE